MIMLSARIVAHPSERRELAQALLVWLVAARNDTGLVTAQVYEDLEAPAVFGLVTEWKAATGLDAHLRSEAFGILLGALKILARPLRMTITRPTSEPLTDAMSSIDRLWNDVKPDA